MAQDPRRYRRKYITLEGTQKFDLADTRAFIAGSQSLESKLDRISKVAFGEAREQATQKGKEYGVQNRPSIEQIRDSISQGQDPGKLLVEGGTAFGDAARVQQGALLKQDLLNQLTTQFKVLSSDIKTGVYQGDTDSVVVEMNAGIEGYARVLGRMDPDQEASFRAAASQVGFSVVQDSIDRQNALSLSKDRVVIQTELDNTADYMESLITRVKNPIDLDLMLQERDMQFDALAQRDPENYDENVSKYKQVRRDKVTSVVGNYILENNLIASFRKDPSKNNPYYALMRSQGLDNSVGIAAIRQAAVDTLNNDIEIKQKERELANEMNFNLESDLYVQYLDNEITEDQLLQAMTENGIKISRTFVNGIREDSPPSTAQIDSFDIAMSEITSGLIGRAEIKQLASSGKVTSKQKAKLYAEYRKYTGDYKDGNRIIAQTLGVFDMSQLKISGDNVLKQILNSAQKDFMKAMRERGKADSGSFSDIELAESIAQEKLQVYITKTENNRYNKYINPVWKTTGQKFDMETFLTLTDEDINGLTNATTNKPLNPSDKDVLITQRNKIEKLRQGIITDDVIEDNK
jgi:hypothetical protein